MEQGGWLTRKRDSRDERVLRVFLTEQGAALQKPALAIPASLLCAVGLEPESFAALRDSLRTVGNSLRKGGEDSAA